MTDLLSLRNTTITSDKRHYNYNYTVIDFAISCKEIEKPSRSIQLNNKRHVISNDLVFFSSLQHFISLKYRTKYNAKPKKDL